MSALLLSWFPPWGNGNNGTESGDDDRQSNESTDPDDRELRVEAYKEEKKVDQLDEKIENHRRNYQDFLEKGANAPESRRQLYAMKARLEKFKGNLRQLEQKKATRNLIQLETKRGEKEIQSLVEKVSGDSNDLADQVNINVDQFSEMANEAEAQIHADMEQTQEAMQAMQSPSADFTAGNTEEELIMEDIAKGEASPEEFDIGDVDISEQNRSQADSQDSEWDASSDYGDKEF